MPARAASSVLLLSLAFGCFDPPELDELPAPPLADLGSIDTWAPLAEAGLPPSEDPPTDSGPGFDPDLGDSSFDPALAQLRLTEVLVDPDGKDGGAESPEFVEIENTGSLPVKLAGLRVDAASWPIVDAESLGIGDLELDAGDLLVIRRWTTDVDPTLAEVAQTDGVVWSGFLHSGGLRNADGLVSLEAGTMAIDQLEYGPDASIAAPGSGTSMCRVDGRATDWMPCTPSPGSTSSEEGPSTGSDPIPPGAVVIVEVLANPPGPSIDEKLYEYIEIINMSENPLELDGCRIGDAAEADAPGVDPLEYLAGDGGCESPTCLAPGSRALIVGQSYIGESNGALVLSTDDSTIADGGLTNTEPVVLWDASDSMISSYRLWPDPAVDPLPTDEQPIHRLDPSAADEPSSWVSAPPSPGL